MKNDHSKQTTERCELHLGQIRERFTTIDRRLLALEIIVRGEDQRNGMKAQLTGRCDRFDQFDKKAISLDCRGDVAAGCCGCRGGGAEVFGAIVRFFESSRGSRECFNRSSSASTVVEIGNQRVARW